MNNHFESETTNHSRRNFLTTTASAAAVTTVAPGVVLHLMAEAAPRTEPVTNKVRWGMLINTNKCADGCDACIQACDKEHGMDLMHMHQGHDPKLHAMQKITWMRKVQLKDNLTGRMTTLPMLCQHCEFPPCVDVCPTGASFKRADGIVMVDRHICIGCRFCMMACPYHARSFNHQEVEDKPTQTPRGKGCVESCNFCATRLDDGKTTTACQDACNKAGYGAIIFGDLNNPQSSISKALQVVPNRQIRADLQLNTGVRYSGV
jgi:molybdopterin-containing oxidoreductase family iron-sulfur binding subunit